jgi:hypothetical protein
MLAVNGPVHRLQTTRTSGAGIANWPDFILGPPQGGFGIGVHERGNVAKEMQVLIGYLMLATDVESFNFYCHGDRSNVSM